MILVGWVLVWRVVVQNDIGRLGAGLEGCGPE
jgi:hypothetical protein